MTRLSKLRAPTLSKAFYASAFALSCCLLLGGGASNLYLTNAIIQVLTLPCLIFGLERLSWSTTGRAAKALLLLIIAAALVVLLQLIPLPPTIWSHLPLRGEAVAAREAIGAAAQWAPISLTPDKTIVGSLTLLPPLAVFLCVFNLSGRERRLLTLVALAFGLINAFVGLLQLSQGEESPFYFYRFGGTGDSVGLFANRNHEAALLYSLTPLAAAWIGLIAPELKVRHRGKFNVAAINKTLAAGVTAFILIVATLMTRSRAGVLLLMLALAGSMALQPWRDFSGVKLRGGGVFAGITVLAMLLGLQFGLYNILRRFEAEPFADKRITFARNTAAAAMTAAPVGTGIGSFVPVYASIEAPEDVLRDFYVNHAHNDFLEVALEAGIPGVALILGFLAWYFFRARDVWRRARPPPDILMARAATISIGLLLAHALFDYALRTDAILAFFTFACALLLPPVVPETGERSWPDSNETGARCS